MGAYWRNLANTTKPSVSGGDAAILSNYFYSLLAMRRDDNVVATASCSFIDMRRRATDTDKAILNDTSPALCTPVTTFPPIGDAAYNQRAGGGSSHGHRQHAKKLLKIARVVPEVSSRTDRQT